MVCDICKKNIAVVFVNKLENGRPTRQALCLKCAQKQGFSLKNLLGNQNLDEEQLQEIADRMNDMMENFDPQAMQDMMPPEMMEMLTGATPDGDSSDEPDEILDMSADSVPGSDPEGPSSQTGDKNARKKNPKLRTLLKFSSNMTDQARRGEMDTIVGRDAEIDRLMQILNRRTKNNPVLIGEPGVGKTAIAEGLAQRIANGQVPVKLMTKEVFWLDMTALVAGTQFRGQFEARMKAIINEVQADGNIILVIDEVHNLVGAGDAQNSMNAANILKPALAKGKLQIIGTTTLDEYRRYIEKDSALERRFQPIIVDEPTPEDTLEIIKGIRPQYEAYHNVSISDEVIEDAVALSTRYIHQRFLPDKAIDIIDEAAARVNLRNEGLVQLKVLQHRLDVLGDQKEDAVAHDDYEKAARIRQEELKLTKEMDELSRSSTCVPITYDDVAQVVEMWTKIPVHRLTEEESDTLMHLEDRLHTRVIGQEDAVSALSRAIRRTRSGFRKVKKPASFIFAGPTGVGKTELVKTLAVELFGSEDALIRIDMSEYMERHTVSKLIGAPPGYVGYDQGGQLTEKVRRRPYSVILLDEIEKAHADVFNMLLQILDDGRLTDSQGRVVNFENTIIVMTTNAGASMRGGNGLGFGQERSSTLSEQIQGALSEIFRPEFINRIDEIITFHALTQDELRQIVDLMLKDVYEAGARQDIKISVTDEVKEYLVQHGYDEKFGARPLRRLIQREVEDTIAEAFLTRDIKPGDNVQIILDQDKIQVCKVETSL